MAVITAGIPEKNTEWYVRWAQKFSRSIESHPLKARLASDIRRFLLEFSMQDRIQPWQVQQAVVFRPGLSHRATELGVSQFVKIVDLMLPIDHTASNMLRPQRL